MKVAIGGGPRSGKSTLATKLGAELGATIRRTDHLFDGTVAELEWSEASAAAALWFETSGARFVIEGVAVARALRKWLSNNPEGKPCDRLIWMTKPFEELSKGQVTMWKGCQTVLREILPELKRRGVEVVRG